MKAEIKTVKKLLDIQGEIGALFTNFAFELKALPKIAQIHPRHGWHNPNFQSSTPTFHTSLTAWQEGETGFSWAIIIQLKEDRWMIMRQVRKHDRSGHSDAAIDFPTLEANCLDELTPKLITAAKELIESAPSLGSPIPEQVSHFTKD